MKLTSTLPFTTNPFGDVKRNKNLFCPRCRSIVARKAWYPFSEVALFMEGIFNMSYTEFTSLVVLSYDLYFEHVRF